MPKDDKYIQIAIDGPVAAGKGTVSKLVANELNILYIDTGAMYRMVALLAKNNGLLDLENRKVKDIKKLIELTKTSKMQLKTPIGEEQDGRKITAILNGEDVSWKIRVKDISTGSSMVAKIPEIREILVKKQQEIAKNKNIIMEGRDITYRVLPNADIKIFLTASEVERAKRRYNQFILNGFDISFEKVYQDLIKRDEEDKNRKNDPLKIVEDAWIIDNTDLTIEQNVELIVARAKVIMEEKNKS